MTTDRFNIRPMRSEEIVLATDWAATEGWNPGLADASCFALIDPQGFLIGELDGEAAACISMVNYEDHFAFLGFYIVRPDLRGRGFGWRIWRAAIAHAGQRTIGLDGVVAQQDNYRKSGFVVAHRNIRYSGMVKSTGLPLAVGIVPLSDIPINLVAAYDVDVFPAPRLPFLSHWIETGGHIGRALLRDGDLAAWGVIRPCRTGFRIGPLFADDSPAAQAVLNALVTDIGGGEIFIDVPENNLAAVMLAEEKGLKPVFETARMYTGSIRTIKQERIFGVTSLELG